VKRVDSCPGEDEEGEDGDEEVEGRNNEEKRDATRNRTCGPA
jgi:hypothetical protein